MPEFAGPIKFPVPADRYNTAYGEPQWWKELAETAAAAITAKADVGHTHSALSNGTFSVDLSSAGAFALRSGSTNMVQWNTATGTLVAGNVPWARITGAPAASTPTWADISGKPTTFPSAWADVSGKPTEFTPAPHDHTSIKRGDYEVGLSSAGAFFARSGVTNTVQFDANTGRMIAGDIPWARLTSIPASFPPAPHTHDDRYYTRTETDTAANSWDAAITALNAAAA